MELLHLLKCRLSCSSLPHGGLHCFLMRLGGTEFRKMDWSGGSPAGSWPCWAPGAFADRGPTTLNMLTAGEQEAGLPGHLGAVPAWASCFAFLPLDSSPRGDWMS